MPTIEDAEFGEMHIRVSPMARRISVRLAPDGRLQISTPARTPKFVIKAMIQTSRNDIRRMLNEQRTLYLESQPIGKSHHLVIQFGEGPFHIETQNTKIAVKAPDSSMLNRRESQEKIRDHILKALRKEAKSYLPRRLSYLAKQHGFHYSSTKLTHAGSRWGSCSSRGTISMNISLMQLPFELIDYVLIHELCHTRHMDHSHAFWRLVGEYDPNYETHRRALKHYTPRI